MKKTCLLIVLLAIACSCAKNDSEKYLDFLYSYMPLPDKIDYSREFYEENVECSLKARREMSWGKSVPEHEFKHFVIPVRVNNENLDRSRMVFYEELKDRVKGLSMEEAILEVNHWCHEKVVYTPSDSRTSSPLASVKTAYGRCGEESTFTVAALRSVGIPARQVYTPRWAHTDDNHAWVEAWANGKWHFLGACEPEAVLNLGWFNAPASRGLLMHTKVFGDYDGPEDVMRKDNCYTEINVTANYAPVAKAYVKVTDKLGRPVEGARVRFGIYNYAEFYPVATRTTDKRGLCSLETGKGDMIAWAVADGLYGFEKCSAASSDTAVVVLSHSGSERYSADMTIVPPAERNTIPEVSPEKRAECSLRMEREDSIRNAYISTFDTSSPLLAASRGNHQTIKAFFEWAPDREKAEKVLSLLSGKDLRDVSLEVLRDSYSCKYDDPYILGQRISNEMLTPYRTFFDKNLSPEEKVYFKDPTNIADFISRHITIEEESNPQHLKMSPEGVWVSRKADLTSAGIFFVALSRSVGTIARIDPVTGKVQYATDSRYDWKDVSFGEESQVTSSPKGKLTAKYRELPYLRDPKYYSHFTLSRIQDGFPTLMNYEESDSYNSLLKEGSEVDCGDYVLTSGSRLADGSVLVHMEFFPVGENRTTEVPLIMRNEPESIQVIGSFNSENLYLDLEQGEKSVLSTTGRGYFIIGAIKPGNEPSNHILKDLERAAEGLNSWGVQTILVFESMEDASKFRKEDFPGLPENVHFGVDTHKNIIGEMGGKIPTVIIADTFNRVVFKKSGYTIGLGEELVLTGNRL